MPEGAGGEGTAASVHLCDVVRLKSGDALGDTRPSQHIVRAQRCSPRPLLRRSAPAVLLEDFFQDQFWSWSCCDVSMSAADTGTGLSSPNFYAWRGIIAFQHQLLSLTLLLLLLLLVLLLLLFWISSGFQRRLRHFPPPLVSACRSPMGSPPHESALSFVGAVRTCILIVGFSVLYHLSGGGVSPPFLISFG